MTDVVKNLKQLIKIPIAVKFSSFFTALAHTASQLNRAGADGLVLFNRFYQPDIDISTAGSHRRHDHIGAQHGGESSDSPRDSCSSPSPRAGLARDTVSFHGQVNEVEVVLAFDGDPQELATLEHFHTGSWPRLL